MAYKFAQYDCIAAAPGGLQHHITANEAWDEDDPVVQHNPDLFADEPPYVKSSEGKSLRVERATAAPGEKRRR